MIRMTAAEFKAKCLKLMDMTDKKHETVVITKRGVPVARLVPYENSPQNIYGFMEGTGVITGDVIKPMDEVWNAAK